MKVSLGSWAFSFGPYASHPIPFELIVKRLSEAGYDGIEICGFPPHVTVEQYPTAQSRHELVQLLKDHRLGVSGYSADLTAVNPVVAGNHDRYLDLFRRNVQLCAEIGGPVIRIDSGAAPGSIPDHEYTSAFNRLADVLREAAEIARSLGVRVVWEFEPGFAFNKPSEVVLLFERIGHPNFGVLFDTSHAYMCGVVGARQHAPREVLAGGVLEFLRRLSGRIGHIHLIDSDGTLHADETSTHRPFGEGLIDFKALAPHLLAVPGIEWWCVDLCFWPGAWELVEPSRTFVGSLIGSKVAV